MEELRLRDVLLVLPGDRHSLPKARRLSQLVVEREIRDPDVVRDGPGKERIANIPSDARRRSTHRSTGYLVTLPTVSARIHREPEPNIRTEH